MNRKDVFQYVQRTYGTEPEYLFKSSPQAAVLRHRGGKKWYGIIMNLPGSRLGLETEEEVDVLNVKADPELVSFLQLQPGMFPAYHMNKEHWISILLDEAADRKKICGLIEESYRLTLDRRE